jgi:hypothetical protein
MALTIGLLIVKSSIHNVIRVAAVRNRLVTTSCPVHVIARMPTASVLRGVLFGVPGIDTQTVFIHVSLMHVVHVTVMKVIRVSFVLDGAVATARTMRMSVVFVGFASLRHGVTSRNRHMRNRHISTY